MSLPRKPGFWWVGFALWFTTLWWLSSRVHNIPPALEFQTSDKILHFGWFFGGAGLLSAALFRRNPEGNNRQRILVTIVVVTLVGVLDEYHQSTVPGRCGNDMYDLIADFLGAVTGSLAFLPFRRFLREA